jgi:NAD(P)-dependent dehydrogenase (short-subunit alcohol dehydrogenase family)/Ca2+-binding EF-hand superfamily protein
MTHVADRQRERDRDRTLAAAAAVFVDTPRVAVVTGGTNGVGREVVRQLCRNHGYGVLLAAQDLELAYAVCDEERAAGGVCSFAECDVARMGSIHRFVEGVRAQYTSLDVLVNNAGYAGNGNGGAEISEEGLERTLATNVIGPHLLAGLLLDLLEVGFDGAGGRIIYTACEYAGGLDLGDFQSIGQGLAGLPYHGQRAYRASKQAAFLDCWAFDRRLRGRFSRVSLNTATPGACHTKLMDRFTLASGEPMPTTGPRQPPARGAETIVWLATQNHGRSVVSGYHWRNRAKRETEFRGFEHEEAVWDAVETLIEGAEDRLMEMAELAEPEPEPVLDRTERVFAEYDADGSGSIEGDELQAALAAMGTEVDVAVTARLLQQYDPDGSGTLDIDEFRAMLAQLESGEASAGFSLALTQRTFDQYDADGSGSISSDELQAALGSMGVHIEAGATGRLLAQYDPDGSGELDFQEFRLMLKQLESDSGDTADADPIRRTFERFDVDGGGSIDRKVRSYIKVDLGCCVDRRVGVRFP